jgi:hypothetical protein
VIAAGLLASLVAGCGGTATQAAQQTGTLVVSATSLSFGSVQVGQTAAATLTLSNSGSASIQVTQIGFSSQDFSLAGKVTLPLTIYPSEDYNLTLQFAPSAAGAASGTVTLTNSGKTDSVAVSLSGTGEAKATAPGLDLQSASVSFGDVQVDTTAAQSVTITSSGTAALTISAVNINGSGFTASGLTLPQTLNPGKSADLTISFDPGTTGAAAGLVTLTTNASSDSSTIALSGTGVATAYEVDLTWGLPAASADPPVGYRIYRAVNKSSEYTLLNATVDALTAYADTTVQNGNTYSYYVESVDAAGDQSAPSGVFTVNIPN